MGDVLNVLHIVSNAFYERTNQVFNPRNAMYIARNNGMLNSDVLPEKDSLVNLNTLNDMTVRKYSNKEKEHIKAIKAKFSR